MRLGLKLHASTKEDLKKDADLVKQLLWLGNQLLVTRNAPKLNILESMASDVYN